MILTILILLLLTNAAFGLFAWMMNGRLERLEKSVESYERDDVWGGR